MKIRITNRRQLISAFNRENYTTAQQSKYVGAEVLTNLNNPLAVGFKHTNGSGYKVLTFTLIDQFTGKVECDDEDFSEICKHLAAE